ncbi:MAG: pyruvate kinase [Candidatus Saganbacteria bacterium]|nr:pyruvate kinase [Candidatus Saganbacteria bacterium]
MKKRARTKIICTLGPASGSRGILRRMMQAGMDVVRLNFSHGSYQHRIERIRLVRELNRKHRRAVRIMGDLEGFRIRIGRLNAPVVLRKNDTVWLTQKEIIGSGLTLPFDYHGDLKAIRNGQQVFIDDGNICLEVTGRRSDALKTRTVIAGTVKERKGVNIPGAKLKFAGLTAKDMQDIGFIVAHKLDYIAQSFVRTADDVLKVRQLINNSGRGIKLVAKIETRDGIRNIDSIIKVVDGIMVARGDMGISIPIYEVPIVQKEIIRKCNKADKFVITATQMLESMTENHIPTRAEVTDVANAVLDGSDFVMLSGESAVGKYPVETVRTMDQIIKYTEQHQEKCR